MEMYQLAFQWSSSTGFGASRPQRFSAIEHMSDTGALPIELVSRSINPTQRDPFLESISRNLSKSSNHGRSCHRSLRHVPPPMRGRRMGWTVRDPNAVAVRTVDPPFAVALIPVDVRVVVGVRVPSVGGSDAVQPGPRALGVPALLLTDGGKAGGNVVRIPREVVAVDRRSLLAAQHVQFDHVVFGPRSAGLGRAKHFRDFPRGAVARQTQGGRADPSWIGRVGAGFQKHSRPLRQVVRRHPVQRRHAVGVQRLDVRAAPDELAYRVLLAARHAAHVQRLRAARGHVVHEIGILVEQRNQFLVHVVEHEGARSVPTASVDRSRSRVVILILAYVEASRIVRG